MLVVSTFHLAGTAHDKHRNCQSDEAHRLRPEIFMPVLCLFVTQKPMTRDYAGRAKKELSFRQKELALAGVVTGCLGTASQGWEEISWVDRKRMIEASRARGRTRRLHGGCAAAIWRECCVRGS